MSNESTITNPVSMTDYGWTCGECLEFVPENCEVCPWCGYEDPELTEKQIDWEEATDGY